MKEFIEKLIGETEEKVKVTSLEIIVTGTKDKPYFQIKYKEVGNEYYNIGYGSYDLNNVFGWKDECFEIVNELAEDSSAFRVPLERGGWIPVSERVPEDFEYIYATCVSLIDDSEPWVIEDVYHSATGWSAMAPMLRCGNAKVIAWMQRKLPEPYKGE